MKTTILAAILCISSNCLAVLSGSGTQTNPYLIQSRADFDEFANPANAATYWPNGVHTKLMCNLNLSGTTYTQAVIAPDTDSSTYSFQGTMYKGTFNGNDKKILNLTISASGKDYIGLFGYIDFMGQINNLGIETVNLIGGAYVGGVCGCSGGTTTSCYVTGTIAGREQVGGLCGCGNIMSNCYTVGSVTGVKGLYSSSQHSVGGLCGRSYGEINNCYTTSSVTSVDYSESIGGLCGQNSGIISKCNSRGSVIGGFGSRVLGGLCGFNSGTIRNGYAASALAGAYLAQSGGLCGSNLNTIHDCFATGSIDGGVGGGDSSELGGLCGFNSGIISASYATGSITGGYYSIGGLCGANYGPISNCYTSGLVIGVDNSTNLGGLCGTNFGGTISHCYSIGTVSGEHRVGGLVGLSGIEEIVCNWICDDWGNCWQECYPTGMCEAPWLVEHSFWNTQTSGQTVSSGGTNKTTAEMMTLSTFTSLPANWDFVDETVNGTNDYWMMLREHEDYPRLTWQEVLASDVAGLYGVNAVDFLETAAYWGKTGCPAGCGDADLNNDGTVDIHDLLLFGDDWLMGI